jgi:hypothetical protein
MGKKEGNKKKVKDASKTLVKAKISDKTESTA